MPWAAKKFILYVDDDPQEWELVKALSETLPGAPVIKTTPGFEEAQVFLENSLQFEGMPCMLLLDYNLGPHTGIDLLYWLKARPQFTFPVAIFSNCEDEEDVAACYRAGASFFLRKPPSFRRMQTVLRTLGGCVALDPPDFECLRLIEEYRCASPGPEGGQFGIQPRGRR